LTGYRIPCWIWMLTLQGWNAELAPFAVPQVLGKKVSLLIEHQ